MVHRNFLVCFTICAGIGIQIDAAPLQWQERDSYKSAKLPRTSEREPGFTSVPSSQSGISFTNILTVARKLPNANLMNGSGVALGDYDGDGYCDIYFCDLGGNNILYKNLGNWQFTNVTEQAGVACPKQTSTAAVFADVNGDRKLDLMVSSMGGPNACFINLGNGRFTNTIESAGISSRLGGMSIALADVDGNGTLDLYQANYGVTSILRSGGSLSVSYENGKPVVKGRYAQRIKIIDGMMYELGEPDALYLNDGSGVFRAVSWTDGTFRKADGTPLQRNEIPWDQGLSVMFRDVNGDRAPDIYVCNDSFTPDRLWINDGKGKFQAAPNINWRSISYFSMGVDFGDLDRDGDDDLFVVDMLSRQHQFLMTQKGNMPPQPLAIGKPETQLQSRRNTLLLNNGRNDYSDIAYFSGTAGSEWSWSGIFLDVDLDGWEDVLVSNGFEHNTDDMDIQEQIRAMGNITVDQSRRSQLLFPPLLTPNIAFRNLKNLTFEELGKKWGFDATEVSNGMALADLDNDGDQDVVINCLNSPSLVYRNEGSAPRIGVRLKGKAPNTQGIGARIRVTGGPVLQAQEVMSGGRYLSGDDPMRVFACGALTNRMRIEVTWRNGGISIVDGAEPNSIYEIDEASSTVSPTAPAKREVPLFKDSSSLLAHTHAEAPFEDFQIQPSLPYRLSQFGPGVSWGDWNGDGFDDLIIGGNHGSNLAIFQNKSGSGFERISSSVIQNETSGIILWKKNANDVELLASVNNYEQATGFDLVVYDVNSKGQAQKRDAGDGAKGNSAGGPLALTEVGGEMVLFSGARFIPGKYPLPATSRLFRYKNNKWERDPANDKTLDGVGLVSAAVWSDLTSDGSPELILACEWGPIRIFEFSNGKLAERTQEWGFADFIGLWQSVATGDFDGDGMLDIVAGNWGLNSFYHQSADHQVQLVYGEFNDPGRVDMIETYFNQELKKFVPWRDKKVLSVAFPWMNEKFRTHKEFAQVGIEEILKAHGNSMRRIKSTTLASAIFKNKGNRFERQDLPQEAQYAPAFGISVADFDGDQNEDLFFAQNFFGVREHDSRLDAGRGLLLKGSGNGNFQSISSEQSGIQIFGEQRGCAVSDFDRDGRVDLLVTQNGTETKLLKNQGSTPGLRVRFHGPSYNPLALGAQFRIGKANRWGALQEIQAGSGYWSQNSVVKVVGRTTETSVIQVKWPGGKQSEHAVPPDAQEITIQWDPSLRAAN